MRLAGRVPQTILLSGDDSRSLETLSTALAAGILCEADGPRPCGACLSCRKVQDGVHPDLTLIDEGEEELKVDLARRIKAENAIIPNDGARRVTVIRHAHNMNAYAQNALLKELEEPPHFAFFILTSEKPDALLQTVRSRCTRFALEPSGGGAGRLRRRGDPAACTLSDRRRRETRGQHDARGARYGKNAPARAHRRDGRHAGRAARRDLPRGGSARAAAPARARKAVGGACLCAHARASACLFTTFTDELVHRISRNAASAAVTCALTSDVYRICYQ